jgi:hypothetical protein
LIGRPDEIMGKLEALRRAGVKYVIMSCGGSRESLRRFAHEIMPAFSDEPAKVRTGSRMTTKGKAYVAKISVAPQRPVEERTRGLKARGTC